MNANISRAQFLSLAGAAAATAMAAAPAMAEQIADDQWDYETDVLVCGCGTGGTAAAIEAHDNGAEVLIIEKMDWLGGELRRCGGGIAAAGSIVQEAMGVEDNADAFFDYWVARAEGFCNPELVRVVVDNGPAIIDWVINDLGGQPVSEWTWSDDIEGGLEYSSLPGLNVGTNPDDYAAVDMEPVARCHWFTQNPEDEIIGNIPTYPTNGGTGLWKTIGGALMERGIQTVTETALTRLIMNAEGEVVGAMAEQNGAEVRIKARKAVVVATGNFASNVEMMKNIGLVDIEGTNYMDIDGENDGSGVKALMGVGVDTCFAALLPGGAGTSSFMANGMKIDTEARAINVFGEAVPRLFVSSNAAGGFMGMNYPVCGAAVARNLIFGRIAGKNAAACEAWC